MAGYPFLITAITPIVAAGQAIHLASCVVPGLPTFHSSGSWAYHSLSAAVALFAIADLGLALSTTCYRWIHALLAAAMTFL